MHLPRKSKPLEKALNFIFSLLNTGDLLPGDPLPSKDELAERAGVSPHTILKAFALLKQEGTLEGSRGHRYRLSTAGDSRRLITPSVLWSAAGTASSQTWLKTRQELEKDILNNIFRTGVPLPSLKELQVRYGVSYPTIKKALEALYHDHLLVPYHRGYMVPSAGGKKTGESILLLCPGNRKGEFPANAINETFLRTVGTECARKQLTLASIAYFIENSRLMFSSATRGVFEDITELGDFFGFMVLIMESTTKPEPTTVLHYLRRFHKPMAVFDQLGEWKLSQYYQQSHATKFFEVSTSKHCGRIAGRFLLEKGHTSIAFLSPYHRSVWSVKRLAGLETIFRKAGHERGVTPYTLDQGVDITRNQSSELLARRYRFDPVLDAFDRWREHAEPLALSRIDPIMQSLRGHTLSNIEFVRRLRVLFDRALACDSHTAWVAANDNVAAEAMRYLIEKDVDVPRRLSLMGFDNTYSSIWYGITSYDFNIPALVHNMLDFVLTPRHNKWAGKKPVQIDGLIVERNSARPPLVPSIHHPDSR